MNLKREGIRDFQLLMKWRNRSYIWHLPFPFVGSCCREIAIWRYKTSHVQGNQKQIPTHGTLLPGSWIMPGEDQLVELRETPFWGSSIEGASATWINFGPVDIKIAPTRWCPPVISWFIIPLTIDISPTKTIVNYGCSSHQSTWKSPEPQKQHRSASAVGVGRWHLAGLYGLGAHRIFHAEPRALEPRKTPAMPRLFDGYHSWNMLNSMRNPI